MKNVLDTCIAGLMFYALGYAFAFGNAGNSFISWGNEGGGAFFLHDEHEFERWFHQWAFAAASATIVSGALAERCQSHGYIIFSCVNGVLIYPCMLCSRRSAACAPNSSA